jgi:CBS domain-containing protein
MSPDRPSQNPSPFRFTYFLKRTFDLSHAPFDRLSPAEAEVVRAAVDIGYFRPGETILARDAAPESLFIVLKGCVEERARAEVVSLRGPGESFDGRALVQSWPKAQA